MRRYRKFRQRRGWGPENLFSHQRISQSRTDFPKGGGGSVTVFKET